MLAPVNEYETRGVEDPRITALEGRFYMTYTAYSLTGVRASQAVSEDLISWELLGVILPDEDNKDIAVFPEKIGGPDCLLHRCPDFAFRLFFEFCPIIAQYFRVNPEQSLQYQEIWIKK